MPLKLFTTFEETMKEFSDTQQVQGDPSAHVLDNEYPTNSIQTTNKSEPNSPDSTNKSEPNSLNSTQAEYTMHIHIPKQSG